MMNLQSENGVSPARLVLAACVLLAVCAFFYSPVSPSVVLGDVFMLVGGAAILAAVWVTRGTARESPAERPVYPPARRYTRAQIALAGLGAFCLWVMAEGGAPILWVPGLYPLAAGTQYGLFWAGVFFVALGLAGVSAARLVDLRRVLARELPEIGLVGLVTLLALGARIYRLENAVHMFVDEMHFVDGVTALWADPHKPLMTPMNQIAAFTWIYAYTQALLVDIFGPTLTGIRAASALFGTLTIPAVYLLGRWMFGRRAGLLAALLLAVFPPHIALSRLGLNNIADPLFGTLALAFLARGFRHGGRADFALAGVMLGLTQYFYEGGRLVYPAVAFLWLAAMWLRKERRPERENAGVFGLGFGLAGLPLFYSLFAWGGSYTPRLAYTGHRDSHWLDLLTGPDGMGQIQLFLREQLNPAWYHFFQHPEGGGTAFYYGGGTALILPFLVPAFFLGLFYLVGRGRLVLPGVIVLTVLGNSLIEASDWTARFVVAFPAVAAMMAVGVVWTWDVLSRGFAWEIPRRALYLGAVVIAAAQIGYYFGPHLTMYNLQIRPYKDHQDIGFRARDLPEGVNILLLTDELTYIPHIQSMSRYWDREIRALFVHPLHVTLRGAAHLPRGADLAIFVKPEDRESQRFLGRVFDLPEPEYSPYNVPREKQYVMYFIPYENPNE